MFFGFQLDDMMDVRAVRYCTKVDFLYGSVIFWKIEGSRM